MLHVSLPSRTPQCLTLVAALTSLLALSACSADSSGSDGSGEAASGKVHTVKHARGTTKVPVEPQRVVVLEPVQLDTAIALDVTPVGAAMASNVSTVPAYLGDDAKDIEPVGTVPEPELEKIAALEPDLIIGTESRHSKLYKQLSDVAPTVFMASQADPWQENVELVGKALNKPDEAKKLLGQYTDRCEQISAKYDNDGTTAQLVRPRDESVLSLYGPTSFAGSTLECAGFTIPDRDWENSISVDISPERIKEAQGDYVFVTTADPKDTSTIPAPVRANTKAFPNVQLVDTSYWVSGVGPLGGQKVLDDIERILEQAQ